MKRSKSSKKQCIGRMEPFSRAQRRIEENSSKYLEGTHWEYLEGTQVVKVPSEVSKQFNNSSERKYDENKQQSKSNLTRMIETIYELKIFQGIKEKQDRVIPARQVLVTDFQENKETMSSPLVLCIYRQVFRERIMSKTKIVQCDSPRIQRKFGKEFSSDNAGDGPTDNGSIRICFWNSNGHLTTGDTQNVQDIMKEYQLDILAMSDVRLHAKAARHIKKIMREGLRGYSISCLETSRSSCTRRGGARMNTMGGTLFIVSSRCATNIVDVQGDSSDLGIIGYAKMIINGEKLCIISIYLPIEQTMPGESTVFARLQSYLQKHKQSKSPQQFIKDTAMKWIAKARMQGCQILIGGDFNTKVDSSTGNRLGEWAAD